jgi:hemoglobin-like flavoprotein
MTAPAVIGFSRLNMRSSLSSDYYAFFTSIAASVRSVNTLVRFLPCSSAAERAPGGVSGDSNRQQDEQGRTSMALQVDLLEQSFGDVAAQGEAFAAAFYERLFILSPEAKPLFAETTMDQQEQKLLAALALVMERLREPEALTPLLKHLGERRLAYHVTPEHFELGGEALLETLRLFLGTQWTPELQAAWAEAYTGIVTVMLDDAPAD